MLLSLWCCWPYEQKTWQVWSRTWYRCVHVAVAYSRCSVLLWRHCSMLCISGFIDEAVASTLGYSVWVPMWQIFQQVENEQTSGNLLSMEPEVKVGPDQYEFRWRKCQLGSHIENFRNDWPKSMREATCLNVFHVSKATDAERLTTWPWVILASSWPWPWVLSDGGGSEDFSDDVTVNNALSAAAEWPKSKPEPESGFALSVAWPAKRPKEWSKEERGRSAWPGDGDGDPFDWNDD